MRGFFVDKLCRTCWKVKDHSMFGIRAASPDGLSAKCRSCQSAYDKARAMSPHRVAARAAYAATDAGIAAISKAKKKYNRGEKKKQATARWQQENSVKRAAHIIVGSSLKSGVLTKAPCVSCGSEKSQAHHEDYSKPLLVVWLCAKCHRARHDIMKLNGIDPMANVIGDSFCQTP